MNKILITLLIFIQLFSINAVAIFDCDNRYFCSDESIFNKDYLDQVKTELRNDKNNVFYLFDVTQFEVDIVDENNKTTTERKKIWKSLYSFGNGNFNIKNYNCFSIAAIKDNFDKVNRKYSDYLYCCDASFGRDNDVNIVQKVGDKYIVKNKTDNSKYETLGSGIYHCPVIFELKIVKENSQESRLFFCSEIDIVAAFPDNDKQNISLFKNNCIKKAKIIEYFSDLGTGNNLFKDCKNIEEIDLNGQIEFEIYGKDMFKNCENLKDLKMSNLIAEPDINQNLFYNCPKLENITFNKKFNLKYDDIKNIENIKNINMIDESKQTKKLENITREDKLDIFLSDANRYIKLREYYKKATPAEINFLNKYEYASKDDSAIKRELDNRIKGVHGTTIDKNKPKINTPGTPNCCCGCCVNCCSECCKAIGG